MNKHTHNRSYHAFYFIKFKLYSARSIYTFVSSIAPIEENTA